jgi:hypothetical protein
MSVSAEAQKGIQTRISCWVFQRNNRHDLLADRWTTLPVHPSSEYYKVQPVLFLMMQVCAGCLPLLELAAARSVRLLL